MGKGQDVGALLGAGTLLLGIAAAPVLWFVLTVRAGDSPSKFQWFLLGLDLFAVVVASVSGLARLAGLDEDAQTATSAIVAIVLTATGLFAANRWADSYEHPLASAVGAACRGDAVKAAPRPAVPRRVVVLDNNGHGIDWTGRSASWVAKGVHDADLVACVKRSYRHLETCSYHGVPAGPVRSISRYAQLVTVRIVEARTATAVERFTLRAEPRACRKVERSGRGDLHGHVSFETFSERISDVVTR